MPSAARASALSSIDFSRARIDAAALRHELAVVIVPARSRQLEQPLAFLPAGSRIRIGIDEDVAMIERGDQLHRLRQQHSVAEDVTRHVPAAGDRDRIGLNVDAHLQEMALDGDPRAAGGDAHRLMVVTVRSAACESVAEPEVAFERERIGDVREGRGALIGRDHEIRIVAIVNNDAIGVHHLIVDQIIRNREE